MIVLILNNSPLSLRGFFSLYLIEIRANVFFGKVPKDLKKNILDELSKTELNLPESFDAICLEILKSETIVHTYGTNKRKKIYFDGLELFSFKKDNIDTFF